MAASVYGIHANVCLARSSPHTHLRPVVANTNTQSASTRLTSTHTHHLDHVCDVSLAMDMLTRFSVAHMPQNHRNALCCTPVPFVVHTLTFHSSPSSPRPPHPVPACPVVTASSHQHTFVTQASKESTMAAAQTEAWDSNKQKVLSGCLAMAMGFISRTVYSIPLYADFGS